jgi:alkylhydroperoxidase family enzyme
LTEDLVAAVLNDLETAPLPAAEKALLRFVDKTNRHSTSISREDIVHLHQHGWTDEAIYDAITVCALFNFYNRWVDASGVHAMSDDAHRMQGKQMAEHGYMAGPKE